MWKLSASSAEAQFLMWTLRDHVIKIKSYLNNHEGKWNSCPPDTVRLTTALLLTIDHLRSISTFVKIHITTDWQKNTRQTGFWWMLNSYLIFDKIRVIFRFYSVFEHSQAVNINGTKKQNRNTNENKNKTKTKTKNRKTMVWEDNVFLH